MAGRYVWHRAVEYIAGIAVRWNEPEWQDEGEPSCPECNDFGEVLSEDGEMDTCPKCDGDVPAPVGAERVVTWDDE